MSLLQLNNLNDAAKRAAYASIVPPRFWEHLAAVDRERLAGGPDNPQAMSLLVPEGMAEAHLRAPARRIGGDFALSIDLEEAGAGQLELSFIIVNDLTTPRFNIDLRPDGRMTLLGTASRNIPQELGALHAGLGPCQVRRGLGLFAELQPRLEDLARKLGYVAIVLEPLTYHNAVMYENHGFAYIVGRQRMIQINKEFKPGGRLTQLLDNRSLFRAPELAHNARGRSWAIHDNILEDFDGESHLEIRMVKVIGQDAGQRTFEP